MSNAKITRSENTYVNGKLYAVKVYYSSGVVREYFADSFNSETDCLYPDCRIFGGCPPECDYKRFCSDYDGEALQ